MIEFREAKKESEYNPLIISKKAPFTQAWFFGEWQEKIGRKARRFEIIKDSEIVGFFQFIKYQLPFSQSFLYIPHGPIVSHNTQHITRDNEFLEEFYKKLVEIGKEENVAFVRFDPMADFNILDLNKTFSKAGFKKTPASHYHSSYFQPKYEWTIDLTKTEDELLNEMHPKTRYNVGLAKRRGVKIEIVNNNFEGYFNDFHLLLEETAKRDNFGLHPKIYYQNIWKTLNSNNAFLTIARYENKALLINLVLLYGETAYFLFGGSSDEHKNLMFSHLAHWESMKESKKRGFNIYNFGGVYPSASLRVNVSYKTFEGFSIFKKRFGGKLLEYSDSYDLILKPFWYELCDLKKRFL